MFKIITTIDIIKFNRTVRLQLSRNSVQFSHQQDDYKRHCNTLGLDDDCSQDDIRRTFIKLAKRFHPDSGSAEASPEKFKQIETAFRFLKNNPKKPETIKKEPKEMDIKHTAPQHRQYLSYEGVGAGTPYQRQQEYAKLRAQQASENVLKHRIDKEFRDPYSKQLCTMKSHIEHKVKTKYGLDRIVEDMIQEAMSKGEFNNLSGTGKPLKKQNFNPYVDFTTHKMNEILIDSGFTPAWITLQKEIREDIKQLKKKLHSERAHFGPLPLSDDEQQSWEDVLKNYNESAQKINKKIQNYNLLVPSMAKQLMSLNIKKLGNRILETGPCNNQRRILKKPEDVVPLAHQPENYRNFLDFIGSLIKVL